MRARGRCEKPRYTDTEYLDAREFMKQFAARRIRYVECEVARATGAHP